MIWAFDVDSHVEEGDHTFVDKYWDQEYRGRRPKVVETDDMGSLQFIIDSIAHHRLNGPSTAMSGGPLSKNGKSGYLFDAMKKMSADHGLVETLESIELQNAPARLEQMDREGVAVSVNYPSLLLTDPIAYDPEIGCAVARAYNSWLADVSSQAPDRLKWVTVIYPHDVEESVKEIRRTKALGSVGLMLLGTVGDKHLDDPSLEPIWATVAELDMPVCVHPGFSSPSLDSMYRNIFDAVTMTFVFTQLHGFYAIMRSGLLDRYPNLRVAFMENGSRWVDYMVMRIAENSGRPTDRTTMSIPPEIPAPEIYGGSFFRPPCYKAEFMPDEYIRRGQVFVQAEVDEHHLPYLMQEYGEDFLVFAGDIPHGHRIASPIEKFMARTDISETAKRKMLQDNGSRLYGLPIPDRYLQESVQATS